MQNREILNLRTNATSDAEPKASKDVSGEFAANEDLTEHTRSELRRTRLRLDQQERDHQSQVRRTKILSVIAAVLILTLVGMMWMAYPAMSGYRTMPGQVLAFQNLTDTLGDRLAATESELLNWTTVLPGLADRMDQVQASMSSTLQTARNQAQAVANQAMGRIREEMGQRFQTVQSNIDGLESNQHEAHETVAQLQAEVARLKKELDGMQQSVSTAAKKVEEINKNQQVTTTTLSGLGKQVVTQKASLDELENQIDRRRVEFELPQNRTEEIVPGIYVTVNRTHVGQQQVGGWLQIAPDARIVWIRQQGVQKPLTFYTRSDERAHALVFTRVGKDAVTGYMLVPEAAPTAAPGQK